MLDNIATDFPEHTPRPAGAPQALAGIKVVDFTHFIAGPFATMMLADMGADVLKIEAPGRGDDFRQYPPVHPDLAQGAPFLWSNRNKRSVALDLKTPEGLEVARALAATADVVVENFSSGVMARFGLDYESIRKTNPEVVYCAVSAYGREGAFADRLGFDPIAQAESGFVSMNGYADREGVRALSPVMDISTAMMACNAILGALVARERTGHGQSMEVALFDNAVLMTGYATLQHVFSGAEPQRHGNTSPDTCPSGVFEAQDRSFYINSGNNKIFQRLMAQVVERPDVANDPAFATGRDRSARREELFALLGEAFARQPWSHWQARMRAAGVPCGEVRSVGEAIRSPEARERRLVTRIPHPAVGWVPNMALPIRYGRTPIADPVAAPTVGQHTHEVLREALGYDEARLASLAQAGAFGPPATRHETAGAPA
ncbi:Crotonobetainyl-CoA:carnitine CoA-transferase CaiB [Variovorax sp. OK605]|jgi:crotonobetainyl-CoA:carnitine CoA-transferase CaiB-like acyl-CoA transferase|uniref:CaiB/BaiF CoA transferase family protein n=1 Tax=Variovorax sp. OK605 TaxID=1855317 RepID=UPI0008EC4A03|nr:CoA transferase [Variovorax sp. OK605]SFQ52875.1 Crotonobetainyl-CoA:carnitine CoA-transferase CaiB [Variovorax sp. OK605]